MFSATYSEDNIKEYQKLVGNFKSFTVLNKALNLKGVKQYYILLDNK